MGGLGRPEWHDGDGGDGEGRENRRDDAADDDDDEGERSVGGGPVAVAATEAEHPHGGRPIRDVLRELDDRGIRYAPNATRSELEGLLLPPATTSRQHGNRTSAAPSASTTSSEEI